MQLKRVVLQGFKSFAKRTEMHFDSPVTAIVGPNGTGKSNIVDAIRWALGEQSPRALRGSKMTDLIYSGSDGVRAQNQASVLLELTGEEFSGETTIKRTVDREGQGKYFLGGRPCRLKDIRNLFLDSGVGKNGYALVGQGEVESILLASPIERRDIFEDVAGIARIRVHKEEAQEGLQETERDLERIADIIQELKKREGPLKKEAQRARTAAGKQAELREREIYLLLHQRQKEEEVGIQLESLQKQEQERRRKGQQEVSRWEKRLLQLREEMEDREDFLGTARDDLLLIKTRLQEIKSLFRLNQEKMKNLSANAARMATRREQIKERIQLLTTRRQALQETISSLMQELEKGQHKIEELKGLLQEIREEQKKVKKKQEELERLHFQEREQHLIWKQNRERLFQRKKEYQEREQEEKKRLEKVEEKELETAAVLKERKATQAQLQDEYQHLQEEMIGLGCRRRELQEKRDEMLSQVKALDERWEGLSSRLQLYQEMEEDFQGFFPGVRALMKAQGENPHWGPAVFGVVAHLIQFQPSLKDAMTAALGARGQNVVVRRERDAQQAVAYLRQHSLGRVTFLPLDTIRVYSFSKKEEERLQGEGILGPLIKEISFSEEVAPAILHLLGRVVLAEDLKKASPLARRFHQSLKIVTLNGDLLSPGGAITGGSFQEKTGILKRQGEMQELKADLLALKMKRQVAKEKEKKTGEQLQELLAEEEEKKAQLHSRELRLTALQEEIFYGEREREAQKRQQQDRLAELDLLQEEQKLLQEEMDSLGEEGKKEGAVQEHSHTHLQQYKEQLFLLQEREETTNTSLTQYQVEVATWKQEQGQQERDLKNLEEEKKALHQEDRELATQICSHKGEGQELEKKQELLTRDGAEYSQRLDAIQEKITRLQEERKELGQDYKKEEETLRSKRQKLQDLQEQERSLNLKAARSQLQMENIMGRLEEYGVVDEMPPPREITNLRREQQEVKRLKKELEEGGPVNPGSIQEYQELTQRLTFLTEQSQDLLDARGAMEEVIHQVEGEMKERFLNTFHDINEAFQEVFSRLFQGGSARLLLVDPAVPLESGIQILVQPPGKRLQHLSLLSGGEKALTAIALIFAFLKVEPSPFYILDEIDASLDETNLERFARFLCSFHETQFILITHRRRSMATAQTLYGLTLEDGAASQLIAVQLTDQAM